MAIAYNPSITVDGLILHYDPANKKSYSYSENLLPYSEQIDLWANSSNIIFANTSTVTSPNGDLTAERIVVDPVGITYQLINGIAGQAYTFSFWVRSASGASGTHGVNWYTNTTAHNRQTVPVTGAWNRVSFTFTPPVSESVNVYIADNRSALATITDVYVWGAQLQKSPTLNNYTPTTTSAITPSTTLADLSSTKLSGTLVNSPSFVSSSSGVLNFSSSTTTTVNVSYSASYEFAGLAPHTIEIWMKPTENPGIASYRRLIGHEAFGPRDGYTLYINNPTAGNIDVAYERWVLSNYIAGASFSSASSSILGTWNHVVVTFDGSNILMYRNNTLVSGPTFVSTTATLTARSVALTIGSLGGGSNFSGDIGSVKIYNRALSRSEVGQNFSAQRGRYGI